MAQTVSSYGKVMGSSPWGGSTSSAPSLETMTTEQNKENKAREQEIRTLLDQIIGMYQPGGGFGAGTEAMLERSKAKDISKATSSLISSGLFNTTMTAGLGKQWEEEVGMPSRLKLEDVRYGALGESIGKKASFIESIQNLFPDYGLMSQLIAQSTAAPTKGQAGLNAFGEPLGTSFGKGVGPGSSGINW